MLTFFNSRDEKTATSRHRETGHLTTRGNFQKQASTLAFCLSLSFSRSAAHAHTHSHEKARADIYTHTERRVMAPPRLLGGSGARRERGGGEEDARGAVRNLVRDIKSELAMQREREHVPGGKGDKGTDDGDDARAKKMLEELVEKHFRRGVYVGTFFSSLLFSSSSGTLARQQTTTTTNSRFFQKYSRVEKSSLSLSLVLLLLVLLQAKRPRRR